MFTKCYCYVKPDCSGFRNFSTRTAWHPQIRFVHDSGAAAFSEIPKPGQFWHEKFVLYPMRWAHTNNHSQINFFWFYCCRSLAQRENLPTSRIVLLWATLLISLRTPWCWSAPPTDPLVRKYLLSTSQRVSNLNEWSVQDASTGFLNRYTQYGEISGSWIVCHAHRLLTPLGASWCLCLCL